MPIPPKELWEDSVNAERIFQSYKPPTTITTQSELPGKCSKCQRLISARERQTNSCDYCDNVRFGYPEQQQWDRIWDDDKYD